MNTFDSFFNWFDLIFLVVGGISYLWLWRRHRFWLPRYAHVLAIGSTLVAALGLWWSRSGTSGGLGKEALIVPLVPFVVYFFFIVYGGAEAARQRHERSKRGE